MKHPCRTAVFRSFLSVLAAACLAAAPLILQPASAASSDWARSQGGDVRIVAVPPLADGTIPAVLDIRLKPGWKTYWREPGASGIPPQVTVDPATGITFAGLRFPVPKTFDDGIVRYTGYDRSVALPMLLRQAEPGSAADLRASVFLGICKDICIPVQADLTLSLPVGTAANPLEQARIDDAIAALPGAPAADLKVTATRVDAAAKKLEIAFVAPGGKAADAEIFLAGPAGFSFSKPTIHRSADGTFVADIPYRTPKNGALTGKSAVLVLRAGPRSMETVLAFE